MKNRSTPVFKPILFSTLLVLVTACGGAGGGDSNVIPPDNAAVQAVEPLVGVWDLPGDWNDRTGDEAYLVVRSPDDQGVAEAVIYDYDDEIPGAERNCYNIDGGEGEISQSLTNELFLDLPVYTSAIVKLLPNGKLEISVYSEAAVSGTPPERVLIAERLGLTENELNLCVN